MMLKTPGKCSVNILEKNVCLWSTILADNIVVELPHDFQKPQLTRQFDNSHSLGFD